MRMRFKEISLNATVFQGVLMDFWRGARLPESIAGATGAREIQHGATGVNESHTKARYVCIVFSRLSNPNKCAASPEGALNCKESSNLRLLFLEYRNLEQVLTWAIMPNITAV